MVTTINEGSAAYLTFTFKDENDAPLVPTTVDWRVDDITNGTEILDWASATPGSSISVRIDGSDNSIAVAANHMEERVVTVRVDNGLGTQAFQRKRYRVRNLYGAPDA